MSDTPRTDAQTFCARRGLGYEVMAVDLWFAQKLERELNAAQKCLIDILRIGREAEANQLRAVQRIVGVRDVEHHAERGVM